jgi:O-antigen ligase
MPLPKGMVGGILGNIGVWAHVAFTFITWSFAHSAVYDTQVALGRVPVCLLLFIPLLGIVAAVRTERHFWMATLAWMFGTFHICWNGVTYWIQNGGRADNAGGQGGESNFLGGIICMIGPVAFSLALNAKMKWHRLLALWTAGAYVLGVLASGSRAGLLALIAGLGYWMTQTTRKGIAIGLLLIASACFGLVAPADFWQKMATIVEPTDANPWVEHLVEPSKHERIMLWDLAIRVWKEHPVKGIGPLNYVRVSAIELENLKGAYSGKAGLQTHSTWLQLLAEYGTVGGVVWGGMYLLSILCYVRARYKMKKYKGYEWFGAICVGMEAGALAHAVTLAFNSFQWYDYIYWHFVFGPLALEVANYTSAKLEWLQPGEYLEARPPPRYGPPRTESGMDLDDIDLMDIAPLEVGSRTG